MSPSCWRIQFHFTVALKWNGLKWRQILFNYSPFYNFKLLFFACCLFDFLREFTNYTENELHCDSSAPLSPLFSISISWEWNMWGSTFISHGFRSHNLIHLCDKLHYEGSQWCTALLIRPGTEPRPQPVTCALTHTHTGFLQHTHTFKRTSEVEPTWANVTKDGYRGLWIRYWQKMALISQA